MGANLQIKVRFQGVRTLHLKTAAFGQSKSAHALCSCTAEGEPVNEARLNIVELQLFVLATTSSLELQQSAAAPTRKLKPHTVAILQ